MEISEPKGKSERQRSNTLPTPQIRLESPSVPKEVSDSFVIDWTKNNLT